MSKINCMKSGKGTESEKVLPSLHCSAESDVWLKLVFALFHFIFSVSCYFYLVTPSA